MGCSSSSPAGSGGGLPPTTQRNPTPPTQTQANNRGPPLTPGSHTEPMPDVKRAEDVVATCGCSTLNDSNGNVNNGNEENREKLVEQPTHSVVDPEPQQTNSNVPEPQQVTSSEPSPANPSPANPNPTDPSPTTPSPTTAEAPKPLPEEAPASANQQTQDSESNEQKLVEAQAGFDAALRFACMLTDPESVLERCNGDVRCLQLQRSLPHTLPVFSLLQRLPHLQELDVSDNMMGPQPFRALMLAMGHNKTVTVLKVANNHTDTDCADSVATMIKNNSTLISLNLGGNYLGKDYLSRCIGPSLATNNTLQHLNCEGVGSIDLSVLVEGACCACSLVSLNLAHNTMTNTAPFVKHLVAWLQQDKCCLSTLDLRNCGLNGDDLVHIMKALKTNSSLTTLDVGANQVSSTNGFSEFLVGCLGCPNLKSILVDNVKSDQENEVTQGEKLPSASTVRSLSLSGCQLKDSVLASVLAHLPDSGLATLEELNLANNPDLSTAGLKLLLGLIKGAGGCSSLHKLSYGLNSAEDLGTVLGEVKGLTYLNLRRARMSQAAVASLGALTGPGGLETLILDNIKIANTDAIKKLLTSGKDCSLVALSVADCALTDEDISHLAQALRAGLQLTMLKLSSNRIGDIGVGLLVDSLLTHPTHSLKLIDFSNNRMGIKGAEALTELYKSTSHKTQLHTLNISKNNIEGPGLEQLVSVVGAGKITTLIANNQESHYEEEDMEGIFPKLAGALGLSTECSTGICPVPTITEPLSLKLTGLGGFTGELGQLMDSMTVITDHCYQKRAQLTFTDILQVAAVMKRQDKPKCLMTKEEWDNVIGASKEAPQWLQLADHRERAVYLSHLPAAITSNKMEGLLEVEADCNIDEVVLMKDQMTRKNNGLAWILFSEVESVNRAVDYFNSGEAKVFSQPFVLSRLNVEVDDEGSQQAQAAARAEMSRRAADRAQDEAAHRQLLRQNYVESQARHAYRLANPAYADGRIW